MNMVTNIKNSTLELYYINLQDTIIYIMSTTIYIYHELKLPLIYIYSLQEALKKSFPL